VKVRSLIAGLSMVGLLVSFAFAQPYDKEYRVSYAQDMGMKVEGKDATILKVKTKITPAMIRHYSDDNTPLIRAWRDFGFKKVIFIDGSRTWSKILAK
jgi:hypothetical protein